MGDIFNYYWNNIYVTEIMHATINDYCTLRIHRCTGRANEWSRYQFHNVFIALFWWRSSTVSVNSFPQPVDNNLTKIEYFFSEQMQHTKKILQKLLMIQLHTDY